MSIARLMQMGAAGAGGGGWLLNLSDEVYNKPVTLESVGVDETSGNIFFGGATQPLTYQRTYLGMVTSDGVLSWDIEKYNSSTNIHEGIKNNAVFVDASGDAYFATTQWQATLKSNATILKYNSSGSETLNTSLGGSVKDQAFALTLNPAEDTLYLSSLFNLDEFAVSLWSPSGTFYNGIRSDNSVTDRAYGITTDASGNVIACGSVTNNGSAYVAKLSSALGVTWEVALAGTSVAYSVSADSSGDVYVVGYSNNASPYAKLDAFIVKLDGSTGSVVWERRLSDTSTTSSFSHVTVIGSDVYAIGTIGGYLTVAKYSNSGALQYSRQLTSTNGATYGRGISSDGAGGLIVAGFGKTISSSRFDGIIMKVDDAASGITFGPLSYADSSLSAYTPSSSSYSLSRLISTYFPYGTLTVGSTSSSPNITETLY
jgi:hypothetical protein